jgi:hypothetical protein
MTQSTREAIIDLLFLALYLDEKVSLAEDEVFTRALDELGWDCTTSREAHVWKAFQAARAIYADIGKVEAFVDEHAATIVRDGGQAESLTWLTRILGADGIDATERHFLNQLEKRFYPG